MACDIGLSEDLLFRPSILVGFTVAFSIDYHDPDSANSEVK